MTGAPKRKRSSLSFILLAKTFYNTCVCIILWHHKCGSLLQGHRAHIFLGIMLRIGLFIYESCRFPVWPSQHIYQTSRHSNHFYSIIHFCVWSVLTIQLKIILLSQTLISEVCKILALSPFILAYRALFEQMKYSLLNGIRWGITKSAYAYVTWLRSSLIQPTPTTTTDIRSFKTIWYF